MPHSNKNSENTNKLNEENARVLLQITQQMRTHWSGVITTHLGYVLTVNVGVWSYFAKSYIDSRAELKPGQPEYILLAAVISTIFLGLWRLYARYLDHHIAKLYPAVLYYENVLSVPPKYGTAAYLKTENKLLNQTTKLECENWPELASELVDRRRIGSRGHSVIDLITCLFIAAMSLTIWPLLSQVTDSHFLGYALGMILGTILLALAAFCYQRAPSKKLVQEITKKFSSESKKKLFTKT